MKSKQLVQTIIFSSILFMFVGGIWNTYQYNLESNLEKSLTITNEDREERFISQSNPVARQEPIVKLEGALVKIVEGNKKNKILFEKNSDIADISELNKALSQYSTIIKKPFLSTDEKNLIADSLNNISLIEGSKKVLLAETLLVSSSNVVEHLNAIKFLLESLNGSQTKYSIVAIQDILRDPAVENKSNDRSVRLLIAGDRAELMYGLLQYDSNLEPEIKNTLAGETSVKILETVQKHRLVLMAEVDSEVIQLAKEFNK